MDLSDYVNKAEFYNISRNVHSKINDVVRVIPTNGYTGLRKLSSAVVSEWAYEEFKDIGGEPFDFYENLYDLMWKGFEFESAQKVIDILKEMEKRLREYGLAPGCMHQAAYPHTALSSHLGQIINSAILEDMAEREGHDPDDVKEAYLREVKEAYKSFLDTVETFLPLFGPAGRRLLSSLENKQENIAKIAGCTVRAVKVGSNTVRIEYEDFHDEYLIYCHPEIDEAMRMTRNELLEKKRRAKMAIESVKRQIESML